MALSSEKSIEIAHFYTPEKVQDHFFLLSTCFAAFSFMNKFLFYEQVQ